MAGHSGSIVSPGKSLHDMGKGGAIRMVAPVSTSFCRLDESEIFIHRLKPSGERLYAVYDGRGALVFDVNRGSDPTATSAALRCASGHDLLELRKEQAAARNVAWAAYRSEADGLSRKHLFTIRKARSLFSSFEIESPSDKEGQDVEGPRFTAKTKRLFQGELSVLRDGYENPIAKARKSFIRSESTTAHIEKAQYGVTIAPGVDRAFVAAIAITIDLVFHNRSNAPLSPRSPTSRIPRTISENADGWTSHQSLHAKSEQRRLLHIESSLNVSEGYQTSDTYSSALGITLTCTLLGTLTLRAFLRCYLPIAEVLISIYFAIF